MIKTASALAKKNKKEPFYSPVNHVQKKVDGTKMNLITEKGVTVPA